MSKNVAKTTGIEWLRLSLHAFKMSGYANFSSAEEYVQSYLNFKRFRHRYDHAQLANDQYEYSLVVAQAIIEAGMPHNVKQANPRVLLKFWRWLDAGKPEAFTEEEQQKLL